MKKGSEEWHKDWLARVDWAAGRWLPAINNRKRRPRQMGKQMTVVSGTLTTVPSGSHFADHILSVGVRFS
eukprot:4211475-Alexandrium_andersonii.AAC.1